MCLKQFLPFCRKEILSLSFAEILLDRKRIVEVDTREEGVKTMKYWLAVILYKGRHKYTYFVVSFAYVEAFCLCFPINYGCNFFPFNMCSREGVLDASAAEGLPASQDLSVEL